MEVIKLLEFCSRPHQGEVYILEGRDRRGWSNFMPTIGGSIPVRKGVPRWGCGRRHVCSQGLKVTMEELH